MADNVHSNYAYADEIAGGIFEVASNLIGKAIIDSLRKNFTPDGKMQRGDFYMNQSRELLQTHLQMMTLNDQTTVRRKYADVRAVQRKLEGARDSRFKKFCLAMDYKRLSKATFKIVEKASNRAVDDNLENQFDEATHTATADPQPNSANLQTNHSNPFSDSHAVSSVLSETRIGELDRVEVEAYQSEVTGDAAVILGLHRHDATTQHVVTTFPQNVFSNTSTDAGTNSISTFGEGESEVYGAPSEVGE